MDSTLETALHELEVSATNFALRFIKMAEVRASYVQKIKEMSQSIRAAVQSGQLTAASGAQIANEMRNQIMDMARKRDLDFGRALAQQMKTKGLSLEEAIKNAMKKSGLEGKPFQSLSGADQNRVYMEVIESSGRARPKVTQSIPKLRWASTGLWIATAAVAAYNIGTSENPWWQTGREAANIGGGVGGGFTGGAAAGAAGGVWAGPIGAAVGVIVGGVLGALLGDHAYVEAAGTSDSLTRAFVKRFTGFWTGVDEEGMAKALANEYGSNSNFVHRVFVSLEDSYSTDADDIALAYTEIARSNTAVAQCIRGNKVLRDYLITILSKGWTSAEEKSAIQFLKAL